MPTTKETGMIDIKLRNVKVEDADAAIWYVSVFMTSYSYRRGLRHGVAYADRSRKFYVYRTDKTVVCVGQYADTPETER